MYCMIDERMVYSLWRVILGVIITVKSEIKEPCAMWSRITHLRKWAKNTAKTELLRSPKSHKKTKKTP